MLPTFQSISAHIKFKPKKVSVDNLVFKLHYRFTFLMLLVCTILVTSRQYIGEHIKCITQHEGPIPDHVINTFCFFTTTYTVVRHLNDTSLLQGLVPHPGVGPISNTDEPTIRHAYYQWVPFVLFAQAIMFYLPHYIWRRVEGGRIKALVDGLQMVALSQHADCEVKCENNITVPSRESTSKKVVLVQKAFMNRLHVNRPWSSWLIFCELLNFFNVLLQIWITDAFLGGLFLNLGPQVVNGNFNSIMDPLEIVFPKVTKCDFYKYGASGSIQRHDALCVMALNVINEKIYTFLWFWFLIVAIVTLLGLFYRIATFIFHSRSSMFNRHIFQQASPGTLRAWDVLTVTKHCHFADWLFLYYLAKNMDGFLFRDLFIQLAEEIDGTTVDELDGKIKKKAFEEDYENDVEALKKKQDLEEDYKDALLDKKIE